MPSWAPSQLYVSLGKSIRPVSDLHPVFDVITKMVEALLSAPEYRNSMVFCAAT
jgi:hypothetical protein